MQCNRRNGARKDDHHRQLNDLQTKCNRLRRDAHGGSGGGGGGGGGGRKRQKAGSDCVNFLAGRECSMRSDDGACIFNHEGLVK